MLILLEYTNINNLNLIIILLDQSKQKETKC